jgi:hypothetical protein
MAQLLRFFVALGGAVLALMAWFVLLPSWTAWVAALVIVLAGFVLAERIFRGLATPEQIRADLEDRVRNPPS